MERSKAGKGHGQASAGAERDPQEGGGGHGSVSHFMELLGF